MTQAAPPSAPKKGLSGLAIAGIGCAGLFVLVVVIGVFIAVRAVHNYVNDFKKNPAKGTALLVLKQNPNLDVVGTDDAAGTITVRDKKTGEVVTVSFEDIKNGKFSVLNSKGEGMSVDASNGKDGRVVVKERDGETVIGGTDGASAPPAWVPSYPGAKSSEGMRSEKKDSVAGTVTLETTDSLAQVNDFFDGKLKAAGYETESTLANDANADSAVLTATKEDGHRKITVIVNHENGKTTVLVTYEGAKP